MAFIAIFGANFGTPWKSSLPPTREEALRVKKGVNPSADRDVKALGKLEASGKGQTQSGRASGAEQVKWAKTVNWVNEEAFSVFRVARGRDTLPSHMVIA